MGQSRRKRGLAHGLATISVGLWVVALVTWNREGLTKSVPVVSLILVIAALPCAAAAASLYRRARRSTPPIRWWWVVLAFAAVAAAVLFTGFLAPVGVVRPVGERAVQGAGGGGGLVAGLEAQVDALAAPAADRRLRALQTLGGAGAVTAGELDAVGEHAVPAVRARGTGDGLSAAGVAALAEERADVGVLPGTARVPTCTHQRSTNSRSSSFNALPTRTRAASPSCERSRSARSSVSTTTSWGRCGSAGGFSKRR